MLNEFIISNACIYSYISTNSEDSDQPAHMQADQSLLFVQSVNLPELSVLAQYCQFHLSISHFPLSAS